MPKVTLYVIPGCFRCRQARALLCRHRIAFREVNALQSPKSLVKLPSGVQPEFPVVAIGARVMCRPDLRTLASALRKRRTA